MRRTTEMIMRNLDERRIRTTERMRRTTKRTKRKRMRKRRGL